MEEAKKRDWSRVNRRSKHQVNLRLSLAERMELEAIASSIGVSMAGYVKGAAFGRPIAHASRRPIAQGADLRQLLGLVGKLGSDANQIARACDAGTLSDHREAMAHLAALKEEMVQVRALLIAALGNAP